MNGLKTGENSTVIGRGATLKGELISTEDVVIEGAVEGTVNATGARLTVSKDARVRADLNAQEVVVLGRVDGNIRATERAELRAGAMVTGDVYAKRFAMEQDAMLRGRVDPTRAGEPLPAGAPVEAPRPTVVPTVSPSTASAPVPVPSATPSLFGGAAPTRPAGQMPAGLAAAARSWQAGTPAGINALSTEPENESEDETA